MEPRNRGPHYAPLLRVMGWRSGGTGCDTVSEGPLYPIADTAIAELL
jgi:hypothetical protein